MDEEVTQTSTRLSPRGSAVPDPCETGCQQRLVLIHDSTLLSYATCVTNVPKPYCDPFPNQTMQIRCLKLQGTRYVFRWTVTTKEILNLSLYAWSHPRHWTLPWLLCKTGRVVLLYFPNMNETNITQRGFCLRTEEKQMLSYALQTPHDHFNHTNVEKWRGGGVSLYATYGVLWPESNVQPRQWDVKMCCFICAKALDFQRVPQVFCVHSAVTTV